MPTISLCMIVKNEQEHLPECLASVKGIVDEMIIVDTGSEDNTKHIAREAGARVVDFAWCDDFSAARNESVKHATGDWILFLDADEVVSDEDAQKIKALLSHTDEFVVKKVMGFLLNVRNHCKSEERVPSFGVFEKDDGRTTNKGAGFFAIPLVRLFKNGRGFRFAGRIHESVHDSIMARGYGIARTDIVVDHYGFLKSDGFIEGKSRRYLSILGRQIAQDPEDVRANYYLGRIYKTIKNYDMALHHLLRVVSIHPEYFSFTIDPYTDIGDVYFAQEHYNLALSYYEKSKQKNPYQDGVVDEKIARCEELINLRAAEGV